MKVKQLDILTSFIRPQILHFEEIDSTNKYLLEKDHPNGTVALADFQSAGRGRLDRKWEASKSDALLFSLVLSDNINQYHPCILSLITSVAVYESLKKVYYHLPLALKWPNDVISNKKKLCGILIETRSTGSEFSKIVIGIGVNINQSRNFFEKEGLDHGTSLLLETGQQGDRIYILKSILEALEENLFYSRDHEIQDVLYRWKNYCPYIGKIVKLNEKEEDHIGIFEDLTPEGGMILNQNGERKIFYAADVSFDKEYL
ncbi:MAG: biotin--[acetyl-CoA-carboxylase] ligase [Candidatus Marinimicrobia bacterium]|nr:biotin--[acetyl-CoA-carboxylase] ligase [Candidatus Neomarinimicrobiota bacterium]